MGKLFLVDFYDKKTKKFIKREILSEKLHNIRTELEADQYIKENMVKDTQYYCIRIK